MKNEFIDNQIIFYIPNKFYYKTKKTGCLGP